MSRWSKDILTTELALYDLALLLRQRDKGWIVTYGYTGSNYVQHKLVHIPNLHLPQEPLLVSGEIRTNIWETKLVNIHQKSRTKVESGEFLTKFISKLKYCKSNIKLFLIRSASFSNCVTSTWSFCCFPHSQGDSATVDAERIFNFLLAK